MANFLMFYVGWFACVAGAGQGWLWMGPVTVAALLLVHLALTPDGTREGWLILLTGGFGFALDTLLASAGLYAFDGTSVLPWLAPPWMVALWMLFAATLNGSMQWLAGRYRLAAVLGALSGPLSYLAGARLGAITLAPDTAVGLGGIAVAWAIALPAVLWMHAVLFEAPVRRALAGVCGALALFVATTTPAPAAEIEGVQFADRVRTRDVGMHLRCVGLLRYKVVIKAYVAALYLGEGVAAEHALGDVPKRLELSYFWSIDGADFGKAGDEILKRNLDTATFATLRPRLDRINALYRDVKPGDRYALTYVPGVGTHLELNGGEIGLIEGADFANAYFRIWLGEKPLDARLRDQLLGCPRSGTLS